MTRIPRDVLSDALRKLLTQRRVTAGVFLTYTFEPQFFEEEVLSLLSDEMVSFEPKLRMLTLEELLRSKIGPVAVYYDRGGLRGDGAARLDVRYIPIHLTTGVFHPKVVLLLTEPDNPGNTKLLPAVICGVLSSNLTKGGWWSHLECAHFEVVEQDARCSYRDDLLGMVRQVRLLGERDANHEALDAVQAFLKTQTSPTDHATSKGRLRPRICAGMGSLTAFLNRVRGDVLRYKTLEVISPFFDEHSAAPLRVLMTDLDLREAFVYLPRSAEGAATCSEQVYQDVLLLKGARWAQFRGEEELLRIGKDKHAKARSVHAKVYRFTDKLENYEALVIGSHNLTSPATNSGGNFEASFLVEPEVSARVEHWLSRDEKKPPMFGECDPALAAELPQDQVVIPLQVKFNWTHPRTCRVLWEGTGPSPKLTLSLAGAAVLSCEALPVNEWKTLSDADTLAVQERLVSSALLTVHRGEDSGTILVQEEGMARKPSILLTLSPAEILAYWSRLTVAQRVQYLEERLGGIDPVSLESQGLRLLKNEQSTSMFDTYAGIFHGFEMLREQVSQSLSENHPKQAEYLLFGDRHDSLPRLLRSIVANEEKLDVVARYLMMLSARQLLLWLRRTHSEFAGQHALDVKQLISLSRETKSIRAELSVGTDHVAFLDWFESHFARRQPQARPAE